MRPYHDLGGQPAGPIERQEHAMRFWEMRLEAAKDCLARRNLPLMRVDEMRRGLETLGEELYDSLGFYERRAVAIRNILVEKGILSDEEIDRRADEIRRRRDRAMDELPASFDHSHEHEKLQDDGGVASPYELMSEAMIEALIGNGTLGAEEIRARVAALEKASPEQGARVVARAWVDPEFKARLLDDGNAAVAELGITSLEAQLVVLENTEGVHNVVVCTLCSCYPRSLLGQPPAWYVSKAYRARTVREPRKVLAEFGTIVADSAEVRVHDSTADMRYLVLPMRPEGTEGWSEDRLAGLVARDSLVGVTRAREPDG